MAAFGSVIIFKSHLKLRKVLTVCIIIMLMFTFKWYKITNAFRVKNGYFLALNAQAKIWKALKVMIRKDILKLVNQWFSTLVPRNPWVPWKSLGVPPISELYICLLENCS